MKVSLDLIKAIEDYKNGDQIAFNVIYNESHRYIYVCVNNVVSGNDNKEEMICDIMQDTYVEISKHIDSLQNANLFLSWAGTIATRKCYEYIKKSGKYVLLNEDESFDTLADDDNIIPEEIMQNKEKQNLLRDIIQNELTEMQKLCIVGYFYNEMKQSEIAEELGIPENSVKSHLLRAKAKIKDAVVDLEKNKGTKLYSVSPLLLLLFADEVQACVVSSTIGQTVLAGIGLGGAQVAATSAGVTSAGTAVTTATAEVGAATTTAGTTAATVVTTAAKGAVVAFKVKAIAIASAAVLTVAGVGTGVGIAIHNKNEAKETEVTTEETTKEIVTEVETEEASTEENITDENVTDDNHESVPPIAQIGQKYLMDVWGQDEEDVQFLAEQAINGGVESIQITEDEVIITLFEEENINNTAGLLCLCSCQLLDKKTGEVYRTTLGRGGKVVVFERDFDINDYYLFVGYSFEFGESALDRWEDWETCSGLFFEMREETTIWDEIEFSKCGEMCSNRLYTKIDINESEFEILEYNISCMVESITVSPENIVIELEDIRNIENNSYIDFNGLDGRVYYQLINKATEETVLINRQSLEETTITIDRAAEGLTDVSDYVIAITYDNNFSWNESGVWLFYELPKEEPDDGLKATLVKAAEKIVALEEYYIHEGFVDYDGDRIPEFLVLHGGNGGGAWLRGELYKYINNEYVYYMDIKSIGDGNTRWYRDVTDGSYAVLEIEYYYFYNGLEADEDTFRTDNEVYLTDIDTKQSTTIMTKEGDACDMWLGERTFYNDDGTTMTTEEFVAVLDDYMSPQYEYICNLNIGYEGFNEDDSSLVKAYNYYLLNQYLVIEK